MSDDDFERERIGRLIVDAELNRIGMAILEDAINRSTPFEAERQTGMRIDLYRVVYTEVDE